MNRDPVAVVRLNHDVPARLEDIINKALEKDSNLRYQHASEMRSDLQRLKRDTDSGRRAMQASTPGEQTVAGAGTSSGSQSSAQRSAVSAATMPPAKKYSDRVIGGAVAVVALLAVAAGLWFSKQ